MSEQGVVVMNTRSIFVIAVLLVSSVVGISLPDTTDADGGTGEDWWYCYGDHPTLTYPYSLPAGATVSWAPYIPDGSGWVAMPISSYVVSADHISLKLDVTAYDKVKVVQTVTSGGSESSATIYLLPLHTGSAEFKVTFWYDWVGGIPIYERPIGPTTTILRGSAVFQIPDAPSREGYSFAGWYTSDGLPCPDNTVPVTSNLDIVAKWVAGVPSGPNPPIIIPGQDYVVTFQCKDGLRYDLVTIDGNDVEFMVGCMNGFVFDMDTLVVTSDRGDLLIPSSTGVYTLSDVHSNIIVSMYADRFYEVTVKASNSSVSGDIPDSIRDGGSMELYASSAFGWAGLNIKVTMGGQDVTSECTEGSRIVIDDPTGDIVIDVGSSIPWLYILIAALIILAIVIIVIRRRSRE